MRDSEDTFVTPVTLSCLACAGGFVLFAWAGMQFLALES